MKRVLSQRGGSMVEFALILPLLLIIIFAIIEFGIIMYNKAIVTNASREGARAGIVFRLNSTGDRDPVSENEIKAVVDNYLRQNVIGQKPLLINFQSQIANTLPVWADSANKSSGSLLTVTVDYQYHWFILPVPIFVPQLAGFNPLPLSATTVMKME